MESNKLNFSGHESFNCRELWLKKGYDFIKNGRDFNQPDAIVYLGVGKNMLKSIQYWMLAFNLLDSNKKLTSFAKYIFDSKGVDPFLEDPGTLWLLHYFLIKNELASIYSLVFNEFRKERNEFTKDHLLNFLCRKCEENNFPININTITKEINVFLRNYLQPHKVSMNFEDLFYGLLADCELIKEVLKIDEKSKWYKIINTEKKEIPKEILLFCILDNRNYGNSISLDTISTEYNSIGNIFAINTDGLLKKIKNLENNYKNILYTDDGGIREIQFKKKPDKWKILHDYYQN